MDTLAALKNLDPNRFEGLVAFYLRRRDPLLTGLIATGTNAVGEPIPCPVDGVLYHPGPPPRCTAVACTTTERKDLKGKWLGKPKKPGDLQKAVEEFAAWRAEDPSVQLRLYLAVNYPLESSIDLYREAIEAGRKEDVAVHVVEASQLQDFLDHDAEGQYIRQVLLGIPAHRMSESLLRKIAAASLQQHRHRFALEPTSAVGEIQRDVCREVVRTVNQPGNSLAALVSPSGYGKSTLLRQVGQQILGDGGIALWCPAEDLSPTLPAVTILQNVLQRFSAGIAPEAAEDALALARNIPGGLLLLVDDLNRLEQPEEAIAALRAVGAFSRSHGSGTDGPILRFLVPLWPTQAETLLGGDRPELKGVTLNLDRYSAGERSQLAALSAERGGLARDLIDSLKGDPFLCGLIVGSLDDAVSSRVSDLVRVSIEGTLRRALAEAAALCPTPATAGEVAHALDSLLALVLKSAMPEPEWEQIRRELGHREADLLYALARSNRLGWIASRDGSEIWQWKHTRLRDALIARWLARNTQLWDGVEAEHPPGLVTDAGLAEACALALAFLPDGKHEPAIDTLSKWQPLALAEALRLGLFEPTATSRELVCSQLRQRLELESGEDEHYVSGSHWFILAKLAQTNDPAVLNITAGLSEGRFRDEARFRNGDIQAGMDWISQHRRMIGFGPAEKSGLFEEALETFQIAVGDRQSIVSTLGSLIRQPETAELALTLAGYLGWPELGTTVEKAWLELPQALTKGLLLQGAWALSRCCHTFESQVLREVLFRVRELSEEKRDGLAGERHWEFEEPLRHAGQWTFTPIALDVWAQVGFECEDLRLTIRHVLRGQDDPRAVETYIRLTQLLSGFIFFDLPTSPRPYRLDDHRVVPTSEPTRNHLLKLALHDEDDHVASIVFDMWKEAATFADLDKLHTIPRDHHLYEDSLRVRLRLRDRSAGEELLRRIEEDPPSWCAYAPLLWDYQGVEDAFFRHLDTALDPEGRAGFSTQQHIGAEDAERMLLHLPPKAIRRLVREKGDLLLRLPDTWVVLLRSDVDDAFRFVQSVILGAKPEQLKFLFWGAGSFHFSVSQRMLDALVSVIERLPQQERRHLAELAYHSGFIAWARRFLPGEAFALDERRYWFSEDAVKSVLDGLLPKVEKGVSSVLQDGDLLRLSYRDAKEWAGVDPDIVVREWLGSHPSDEQIIVAAVYVEYSSRSGAWAWWHGLKPQSRTARVAWERALYMLQRRHWQGENWFLPEFA